MRREPAPRHACGRKEEVRGYGAQGYKHAEHCTEHHSDGTRVTGSRWVVGAGQGVVADAEAQEDRHGRNDECHPNRHGDNSGRLCFGARDRTQIVSTVAGTDPAARSPATRQSTLPFLEWMAVPAVFVVAAQRRSVPTAVIAEEQYQQRRHQRDATHPGQTDESADNKTGEWMEPVHDRYTSALESGFRSFRSVACL